MSAGAEDEPRAQALATPRDSPYQGLVPFEEGDTEWFFGRDDSREVVLDSLRAYRVSVLYGESGVGKSSLLHASVLPCLRQQARSHLTAQGHPEQLAVAFAEWRAEDPLRALKQVLYNNVDEFSPTPGAQAGEATLAEVLRICSERVGGVVFVILDQLEELFLYHASDAAGRAFENELVDAIHRREGAANFLLSIREDALAKLDRLQGRIPGLLENLVRIEHLSESAASEAIERPLVRWSSLTTPVTIEPVLVEQVLVQLGAGRMLLPNAGGIGEVQASGGQRRIEAPYLQLVLARIWYEERAAGSLVLRLETLERLGGAEHIVRTHLDAVLDKFSSKDRKVAALAFRYLVTPSGTKIAHRSTDLAAYTAVPVDTLERVLAALAGEARILRPVADRAYEIYHDVLAAAVLDWRQRYAESRSKSLLARSVVLAIAAIVVPVVIVAYQGHILGGLENNTLDARFAIRGDERAPANIVVIAIDDATFAHLGLSWPFPRALYGRVIEQIARDRPRAIAIDIDFSEGSPCPLSANGSQPPPGRCPHALHDEEALLNAIHNASGKTVFALVKSEPRTGEVPFLGSSEGVKLLQEFGSRAAQGLFPMDSGGVVRRMSYSINGLQTLATTTAEVATGHRIPPTRFPGGSTTIDYAGRSGTIPAIPFWEVAQGAFTPGSIRGKIVVIGPTAPALQSILPTSIGQMSGPEIQANSIETVLRGLPLRPRPGIDLALIALVGLLVPVASLWLGSRGLIAIALAAGGLYALAAQIAFDHNVLLAVTYPLLALVLTTVGVLGWRLRLRSPA
jgi:CHASE2 domain-containing sensor protein